MAKLDNEFKEKLRERVDLTAYIGKFIRLEKSGSNFKCCCPFHNEKTPSFHIFPDRHYHCFGCGESGDIIRFVMKYENHDFLSAVKLLADMAGLDMPDGGFDRDVEVRKLKQDKLHRLMREAALHYMANLKSQKGQEAREYLASRGLNEDCIKKFGVGLALGKDEMPHHLRNKGFTDNEIVESSIGAEAAQGVVDVFANRIVFPIINNLGNVVAFGGRTLSSDPAVAKYYNSRATVIFDKSKTLFGINLLKKKKQSQRAKAIVPILVEGYMDVASLHSAGFDTAVASLGTALTREQARQLKFFGSEVILCYDGDSAGKKATQRGADILKEDGFMVRVVDLPDGLDPDDAIRQRGEQEFAQLLEQALPLLDYRLMCARRESADKTSYARAAVEIIAKEQDEIVQEEYLRRLESESGYMLDTLRRQMLKNVVVEQEQAPKKTAQSTEDDDVILFLLHCWLKMPSFVSLEQDIMPFLRKTHHKDVYYYLRECAKNGQKPLVTSIYDICGEELNGEAGQIVDYMMVGDHKKYYEDCLASLVRARAEQEKEELNNQYRELIAQMRNLAGEDEKTYLEQKIRQLLIKIKKVDEEIRSGGRNE